MKTVAEKIILNYFGKFINGIHKDNLTVDLFKGNFQLENISLNQEYFDQLNTPFKLTYSSIGKLDLVAPISKLSSAPVECTIDNIYAVFEFRESDGEPHTPSPEQLLQEKKEFIEKYIREMFEDYLKKLREKDDKKDDGIMTKLGKKIIDNLQLTVINVHFRFEENKADHKYAWGVTLEEISFMTTDDSWKPTFIDRSAEGGRGDKLLKKMSLKKLNAYWQSGSKSINEPFINEMETHAEKTESMKKMIKDPKYSIISLTSEVKLTINQQDNLETPLYELSVDLVPIVFELEKIQVSEMIDFTKKNISENEQILKNLSLKKKKTKKQLELNEKNKLEEDFQEYVESIIDLNEAEKEKIKPNNQMDDLEKIALLKILSIKVEDEEILLWSLKPIKKKVKETREKELKKKKKGWFGGEYQLNEEETKALETFVDDAAINEKERPPSCLFFSLRVVIEGGTFAFIDNKGLLEEERLEFKIGKINMFLSKSENDSNLDCIIGVEKISLNLEIPIYQSEERLKINIIKNIETQQEFIDPGEETKFIKINYSKKIEGDEKPIIKTDIHGEIQQVIVTYKKMFMKKFKSYFTFNNFNDSLKNETIKKWDQIKEKNEEKNTTIEEDSSVIKMFNIQVKVISPLFVFPIGETEAWCLNLGKLSIKSDRDNEKEIYPIKIESAYFRYYPDLRYCLATMNEQELNEKNIFSLINNINSTVTYVNYIYEKKTTTNLKLPNLSVSFNENQYKSLLSLKDIFKNDSTQSNFIEVLKKERQEVEKSKVYEGSIQKKGGELDKWIPYYGILSGDSIHLYGSEKELKCIEKVSIKNVRLEYNEETKVIQLIDQSGVTEISGTEFENNSQNWRDKIAVQMKSFMTIYEIIEDLENSMETEDKIETPRKKKDINLSLLPNKRIKTLEFIIEKIEFNYKNDKDKDIMVFKLFHLKFESKEQNRVENKKISIKNVEIIDYIHIYKDPTLQKFVSIQNLIIHIQKNKNEQQKKMEINLDLEDIYINWKPDVLIILLKLIYHYFVKEAKLRLDDGQIKTRDQLFEEVLKNPKFNFSMQEYERSSKGRDVKEKRLSFVQKNKRLKELLKLTININKIEVLMIHRQTHLTMFKLIANKIENELAIGENEKFVSGTIHSLTLFEMTGYPKTNYKEEDKNEPYLIVKPKEESNIPLVEYKWSSYEPFVLPNSERINSFMHVSINPIEFTYFQQVTFRFIDYLLIQIILLLNQPEMLVANENLLEQLKKPNNLNIDSKKQEKDVVKILFSEYEEVIRKIIDPYFMDMYFEVKEPSIVIKTEKNNPYFHQAHLKNIIFVNENNKNGKRFAESLCPDVINYVYEEVYEIMCNECQFYSVKGNKRELLFNPVDIILSVNKLIMEDEINVIYPELDIYDRSFQTTTKMSKLVISKLTREEYLLINKLVNFNIVFDDNKDELFIHNFKITKLLSPKPIYYDLIIPEIELIGKEGTVDINYDLFCMSMQGFKLIFERSADLNSSFKIFLTQARLYGFEYNFTTALETKNPTKIELMEFKSKKENENCSDIIIKMKTSGEKIIEMNIDYIEAYLKLHLVQLIFEWSLLEDWVFPTVSIYANDITFHLTIHNMSAWLKETLPPKSTNPPRAFRLVGVFCYKFHRKANFSQQHLEELLKKNEISVSDIHDMPEVSYMTILLNTEIFHCLATSNTNIKRQVMEKVTLNMIEKKYLKVSNEKFHKIKPMNQRSINLDRGLLKFSFTDIFLMKDIFEQIANEREYINKLKSIVNPPKENIINEEIIIESELSTIEKLDINVEALSLYLINNCRSTFIPTLRVHLNNALINKVNTSRKDLLKATFETSIFYFNSSIFKWEPMIEKVDLSLSKLIYRQEEENVFFSLETLKPLFINLSKEMIIAIKDTTNEWNLKSKPTEKLPIEIKNNPNVNKKYRNTHETVELVSQYVIRNEIGYPIEVYSHNNKKFMYKIDHLNQIDYEYELEKYDEESEVEILIGINICHPKIKFKRITHISLGLNINFILKPEIEGKDKEESLKNMPRNSVINFITETKDSKRYLVLKTSKWIEDYLKNNLQITYLPFDHSEMIKLREEPHNGKEVSLYQTITDKDRYRYIGQDGALKIMGKALVYNYTPIPLHVCGFFLLPDQFVTIFNSLTIQNLHYKDCKGIKVDYDEKQKIYYIYCEGYIIDYSNLYYELDETKGFSHEFMTNGIKYTIYLLQNIDNKFKVRLEKKLKSIGNLKCSALIKPAVGNQIFELQNHSNSLYEYQTYGYLSNFTGNEYKDFKKIIEVTPFYVLSNTTNYKIKVCQIESCQSVTLEPGERIPFFWENKAKPKQIKISALKDNLMWGYSGPLSVSHNTHSFVVRNSQNVKDYRILSTQIETTNTINFVHIIDCNPKNGNNIMLCNQIEGVTLTFVQLGIFEKDYEMLNPNEYIFIVKTGEELPFGYEIPLEKHSIKMEIIFDQKHEKWLGAKCLPNPLILDNIENNLFEKKIDIITIDKKKRSFLLKLNFEGNVKKLQLMRFENTVNEIKQGEFTFKIPNIIFSLIGNHDKKRKEIVHLAMTGVELETAKTNRITEYTFTIKHLQIDNCLQNNPMYPVIFQSTPTKNAQYFMQFMIEKDNFNNNLIHYIGLSINKFIISITSEEIQSFQENLSEITKSLNPQNDKESLREYELFQKPTNEFNTTLYFIEAEIHPLKANITFKHVNNWGGRLLRTLASIDDCNLSIAGKKISHFSSRNTSEFFNHLKKHYEEGISKVILPLLGNLAIIGSPLSLAQRIGSGFKDLIELPSEGFNVSPLEGTKGLAIGAGSLVKNTFEGAFNSFESVTGSVGNGISSLAFDDDFSKERMKIQSDKSQHIGEGLANGAKSIANGFTKGITGLVTSPVEGAQENGIGGFFMGSIKGLAGLVVKPVSGIFDATTKTFEGIKNTPSYFGDKTEKLKRKRQARVFYGFEREFRLYDEELSMCAKLIAELDEERFQNLSWYGAYHLLHVEKSKEKKNPILIITHQYILIVNLSNHSIMQKYESENVLDAKMETTSKVKLIIFNSKVKQIGHISFDLKHMEANKLVSELKAIAHNYRPVYGFDYEVVNPRKEFEEKFKNKN